MPFNLARARLLAELALVAAVSFLYSWGSHCASMRAESDTKVTQLEQQVRTLSDAKQETEHDTRTVVHTVTKPDGTKDTTETHERVTLHETERSREQVQMQVQTQQTLRDSHRESTEPDRARYSLELDWTPTDPRWGPYVPTAAHVGARVGDLPVWLTLGAEHPDNRFIPTLGIRYEW